MHLVAQRLRNGVHPAPVTARRWFSAATEGPLACLDATFTEFIPAITNGSWAEQRRIWLPILEAGVERDDENVDREVLAAIRRLRRLLESKPPDPLPEEVEQRRKQTRERVRRYRERRLQQTGPPPETA